MLTASDGEIEFRSYLEIALPEKAKIVDDDVAASRDKFVDRLCTCIKTHKSVCEIKLGAWRDLMHQFHHGPAFVVVTRIGLIAEHGHVGGKVTVRDVASGATRGVEAVGDDTDLITGTGDPVECRGDIRAVHAAS